MQDRVLDIFCDQQAGCSLQLCKRANGPAHGMQDMGGAVS